MLRVLILVLLAVIFVAVIVAILTSRYMLDQDLKSLRNELDDIIPLSFWENNPDAEKKVDLVNRIDESLVELSRPTMAYKRMVLRIFYRQIHRLLTLSQKIPELVSGGIYEEVAIIDDNLPKIVLDDTPTKGRKRKAFKLRREIRRFLLKQVPCYLEWGHIPSDE